MSMSDRALTIGGCVGLQRGTTYKSALLGVSGPYLLGLGSIARNGGFKADNLKQYSGPSDPRILLQAGDIFVSLKDVTQSADLLGAVARVPPFITSGRLTQDTVKLVFLDCAPPSSYIYWLLRTPQYREYCRAHATGTTNLGLSRDDFFAFPVPEFTLAAEKIVTLLESLERRIDLNRRMNETLEAMARAIFKDWFVDFGPTLAKMEGRAPYLPSEIWSLFPDRLDNEGKPKGYREEGLLNYIHLLSGGTPKTEITDYWGGNIAWASAKDVSQSEHYFLLKTERSITERGLMESATRIIPKFSTVVVARGATTGRACMFGVAMAMNQTCYALVPKAGRYFLLNCLFKNIVAELVHAAHGSVFDTITTKTFQPARVIMACEQLQDCFENLVAPMFHRILSNVVESDTLASTRDLLLPKLMSGEIRVKDAEKVVEGAL
jgi:type I restriction enzyme, S subunit